MLYRPWPCGHAAGTVTSSRAGSWSTPCPVPLLSQMLLATCGLQEGTRTRCSCFSWKFIHVKVLLTGVFIIMWHTNTQRWTSIYPHEICNSSDRSTTNLEVANGCISHWHTLPLSHIYPITKREYSRLKKTTENTIPNPRPAPKTKKGTVCNRKTIWKLCTCNTDANNFQLDDLKMQRDG